MSEFLNAFAKAAADCGSNIFRVAEIKDGGAPEVLEIVPTNPCQNVYSVAKAFSVTAVGFLFDEGKLSPDETIVDILGDECPAEYHPYWNETTLDMIMLHHLGLPKNFLDIDSFDANEFGEDFLKYIMTYPLTVRPGGERVYTDAAYYLVSRAVEARAGMRLDKYLTEKLFRPFKMREAAWSLCPMGHSMGATGLYIRAEDMAKLGQLYLSGGIYGGQRLLSEKWVNTVIEKGYELRPTGVGAAYAKGGMRGQMLIIVPETNRVVAWQGFESPVKFDGKKFAAEWR